jgi:hypothetical protein
LSGELTEPEGVVGAADGAVVVEVEPDSTPVFDGAMK